MGRHLTLDRFKQHARGVLGCDEDHILVAECGPGCVVVVASGWLPDEVLARRKKALAEVLPVHIILGLYVTPHETFQALDTIHRLGGDAALFQIVKEEGTPC